MYNAFISYSHAVDGKLAYAIKSSLEKYAKPWYKIRNLNIFYDEESLSVSPQLWAKIQKALDKSEYLVYLASPSAKLSKWVNLEINYWLENKSIDTLLIVLTEGELTWDSIEGKFADSDSNPIPDFLNNKLLLEPFYLNLSFVENKNDISIQNPLFKEAILKLAAQLHGLEPKDLASEAVVIHRKMIRLRNSIIGILFGLLIASSFLTLLTIKQRNRAQAYYLISESQKQLDINYPVAMRLAELALHKFKNSVTANYAENLYSDYQKNSIYKVMVQYSDETQFQSVAFSSDGKYILACTYHGYPSYHSIRLWDLNGNLIRIITSNTRLNSAAFSPNGLFIVGAGGDNTAILWDIEGNLIREFKGHTNQITTVSFSPDGQFILTGSYDNSVRLWDLKGREIKKYISNTNALPFNFMGYNYYTTSKSGKIIPRVNYGGKVNAVTFSPNGKFILMGSDDSTARLWDLTGKLVQTFKGHSSSISSVAFSPDGESVLTGSYDKTVKLWDLEGNMMIEYFSISDAVNSVAFSPNGKYIAVGSGKKVSIIEKNGKLLYELKGNTSNVRSVAFSPDGKKLVSCSIDGKIIRYMVYGNSIAEFEDQISDIKAVAFSPDGKHIVTGSGNGMTKMWNKAGSMIQEFKGHSGQINAVAFSPDGRLLLTGSDDKRAILWDLKGNQIYKHQFNSAVSFLAFTPDGNTLIIHDSTAKLFNLKGRVLREFYLGYPRINSVTVSSDGVQLLVTSDYSDAKLIDMNGNIIRTFKEDSINIFYTGGTISPDNKYIFLVTGNSARLCNNKGKLIKRFTKYPGVNFGNTVLFSPNGKYIASTSSSSVYLWDLKGNLIQELYCGYSSRINSAAFSPDSKYIVTCTGSTSARLWQVMTFRDFMRSNVIEPLTPQQKKLYNF
jgi:WD40 repeat protein